MEKKIIGYFDSSHDIPEEVIMAAGFIPQKILGDVHKPSELADQYLFNTFCPYARSVLNDALEAPTKWIGIIIAHGCDATNRQFDIWKYHVKTPFLYWFNKPLKTNKAAKKFLRKEIEALIKALTNYYNIKITDKSLELAIKISNETKFLLRKLSGLRAAKDIPNADYFNAVKMALIEEKEEENKRLNELIEEWSKRRDFPSNKKKVLLTGSDVNYVEFYELLDQCGLRVVRDDLSIGERYFQTSIPSVDNLEDNSDNIDAIVEYHMKIPRPSTKHPSDERLSYILKCIKETEIDGVIVQNLKFCEPYAFDSVWITNSLKKQGIHVINLERDYSGEFDKQLENRLEAFREML
ncbi:MAG: 2-hydroxyacyl-CoA dehydratase family protein [Promethearchaeota archaeon]